MNSLETIAGIKKISFAFFALLGLVHFLFGGLFSSSIWIPNSFFAAKISFIPFIVAAIFYLYSITKEKLLLSGKTAKTVDYTFLIGGIIIISGLLVIEFLYPDKLPA